MSLYYKYSKNIRQFLINHQLFYINDLNLNISSYNLWLVKYDGMSVMFT